MLTGLQESLSSLQANKVIAIRHAESQANEVPKAMNEVNYNFIDAVLSPEGHTQCAAKQELAAQIDFGVIYLSPLRRSLMTAHCMFKTHPNFSNIKFVLAPLARETLIFAGDVPSDLNSVLEEFSPLFPSGLDTSAFSD